MIVKLGMDHRGLEVYKVVFFFINDDHGLTLTCFTARSNFVEIAYCAETRPRYQGPRL